MRSRELSTLTGQRSTRDELTIELRRHGESWEDVVSCTLDDKGLDKIKQRDGEPFTLWTDKRVYFPAGFDGMGWVESVARHPCGEKKVHAGNEWWEGEEDDEDIGDTIDRPCALCGGRREKPPTGWIRCVECKREYTW